jgi:hypothetical protein
VAPSEEEKVWPFSASKVKLLRINKSSFAFKILPGGFHSMNIHPPKPSCKSPYNAPLLSPTPTWKQTRSEVGVMRELNGLVQGRLKTRTNYLDDLNLTWMGKGRWVREEYISQIVWEYVTGKGRDREPSRSRSLWIPRIPSFPFPLFC